MECIVYGLCYVRCDVLLGVEGRRVKAQVIITCYMCTEYKLL